MVPKTKFCMIQLHFNLSLVKSLSLYFVISDIYLKKHILADNVLIR
jgi:hypothetical protein